MQQRSSSSSSRGLQHWIESRAAGPVFAAAAVCVMGRSATFWSGGAFSVQHVMGTTGLQVFNGITGFGIAAGAELLTSVFGRQWLRYEAEQREARMRRDLHRDQRAELAALYAFHARIAKWLAAIGVLASTAAGFMFLATTTKATGAAVLGELLIAAILVIIMTGFGVFYQDRPDEDQQEQTTAHARSLRGRALDGAGERIQHGQYTAQDVQLVAGALPRGERDRFVAALLPDTPDDPRWTVKQIAEWLGGDWTDKAGQRRIQRRLAKLLDAGVGVVRDERKGYTVPQSVLAMHFAGDFLGSHRRQNGNSGPLATSGGSVGAATPTSQSQPPNSSEATPATVALTAL